MDDEKGILSRILEGFRQKPTGGNFWDAFFGDIPKENIPKGWAGWAQRTARTQGITKGVGRSFVRGAASAWLPIEANPELTKNVMKGAGKGVSGKLMGAAFKWAGPVIGVSRIASETQGLGLGGALSKTARIFGEEAVFTGGLMAGSAIGGSIGAALGTFMAPGVGTAIGWVAGTAIGMGIGAVGSWAWNKFMDVAETPARLAHAGWKYFREAGKRSTRMELGGGISHGNRSSIAYTMRSRALQQMNRSGINARSLLGNEASYMHIRG